MKKFNKKAKIIFLSSGVVTVVLVTFFVSSALVLAQSSVWQGPTKNPPAGNIEGLILNKPVTDPTGQDASINISGDAKVSGTTELNSLKAYVICLPPFGTEDCKNSWGASGGGFWQPATNGIYYNAGNVGIGTATPKVKLHVVSASINKPAYDYNWRAGTIFENNGDEILRLVGGAGSLTEIWFGDPDSVWSGRVRYEHSNDSLNLWTANASRLTINSSGNVGIANPGPDVKLVVGDGVNATGNIISVNGVDTAYTGYRWQTAGPEKWFVGMDNTVSNNDLIFRRNSISNDLIIKNDTGNIGIGTGGSTLDSHNKLTIIGTKAGIDVTVPGGSYDGSWGADPALWNRAGHFKVSSPSPYGSEVYLATSPYQYNASYGVYSIGYTAGVYGEGTSGSGVLGKGQIGGTGVAGGTAGAGNGVAGSIVSYQEPGEGWQTGNGVIGAGYGWGSVGVYGIADTACIKWEDEGDGPTCITYADYSQPGTAVFGEGMSGAIGVKGNSDTGWAGYFKGGKGAYIDKLCLGTETNCQTSWPVAGNNLWIQSGKNIYNNTAVIVGIGTTDLTDSFYKLDVGGNIKVRGGFINLLGMDKSPEGGQINLKDFGATDSGESLTWVIDNYDKGLRIMDGNSDINNLITRMIFGSDGKISTYPASGQPFEVNGNVNILGSLTCNGVACGGGGSNLWADAGTYIYNPGNTVRVYDNGAVGRNDGPMSLYLWGSTIEDTGGSVLRIKSSSSLGNIDFQNSNGTSMMFLGNSGCGSDYSGISLNAQPGNCNNYNILSSPGNKNLFINRPTGSAIYFRENNVTQMTINSGGNVGIGTTSPGQKLEVSGNVKASGYYSGDGSAGLTQTINVRKADNSAACTITVKNGLITATTCP